MLKHLTGSTALSSAHAGLVNLRNRLYDRGKLRIDQLPRPVISIGNLTLGGTGKTPFTAELARLLSDEGHLACILSRGHGGHRPHDPMVVSDLLGVRHGPTESGDEPFMLARRLPGVPVVVGRSRFAAGSLAMKHFPPHLFLLDDGFQHRQLRRDLDIVLVDATRPFGEGWLLPAGQLREPVKGIARAGVIVLTRLHRVTAERLEELRDQLQALAPEAPILGTRLLYTGLVPVDGGARQPLDVLRGAAVFAFAGVGHPEAFFEDLVTAGARVVGRRAFGDHHPYSREDLAAVQRQCQDSGASFAVTTEKDAVRIPRTRQFVVPLLAVRQRLVPDDPALLMRLVTSRLPQQERRRR